MHRLTRVVCTLQKEERLLLAAGAGLILKRWLNKYFSFACHATGRQLARTNDNRDLRPLMPHVLKQLRFKPSLSNVLTRCFFIYNYNILLILNQVSVDFMQFLTQKTADIPTCQRLRGVSNVTICTAFILSYFFLKRNFASYLYR